MSGFEFAIGTKVRVRRTLERGSIIGRVTEGRKHYYNVAFEHGGNSEFTYRELEKRPVNR